jgi:hypothetical protein
MVGWPAGRLAALLLIRFAYKVDERTVECRTYPSMPWVGLALLVGLCQLTDSRWPRLRLVPCIVLPVMAICFTSLSIQRARLWHNEQQLMMNVLHQYPFNLRVIGIYFKNLVLQGYYDPVLMGASLPDTISDQINNLIRKVTGTIANIACTVTTHPANTTLSVLI